MWIPNLKALNYLCCIYTFWLLNCSSSNFNVVNHLTYLFTCHIIRLSTPNSRTYIGSGKVAEIKTAIQALDVETVIFDDELSPGSVLTPTILASFIIFPHLKTEYSSATFCLLQVIS